MNALSKIVAAESRADRIAQGERAFDEQTVQPGMERMHPSLRGTFAKAFADIAKPFPKAQKEPRS